MNMHITCIFGHGMKGICLTFNLVLSFCRYTPILENRITGCFGNHAFSHSPNRFIFEEYFYSHSGYPRDQFGTNEKLSCGVQGRSKLNRSGGSWAASFTNISYGPSPTKYIHNIAGIATYTRF